MERPAEDWDARSAYRFLTSAVAPRPIAWITTIDAGGLVNAAPFSWFNSVCADPMTVLVAINARRDRSPKDTLRNLRASGEFVVNVATQDQLPAMVASSAEYPPEVSEVEALRLATVPSVRVRPPRLAASPVHLECVLERELVLGRARDVTLVLGEVVHVGADDAALDADGNVDPARVTFVARMGGATYTDTARHYDVARPRMDALRG